MVDPKAVILKTLIWWPGATWKMHRLSLVVAPSHNSQMLITTDAGHMHLYTFLLMVLAHQFLLSQIIFKPALTS